MAPSAAGRRCVRGELRGSRRQWGQTCLSSSRVYLTCARPRDPCCPRAARQRAFRPPDHYPLAWEAVAPYRSAASLLCQAEQAPAPVVSARSRNSSGAVVFVAAIGLSWTIGFLAERNCVGPLFCRSRRLLFPGRERAPAGGIASSRSTTIRCAARSVIRSAPDYKCGPGKARVHRARDRTSLPRSLCSDCRS